MLYLNKTFFVVAQGAQKKLLLYKYTCENLFKTSVINFKDKKSQLPSSKNSCFFNSHTFSTTT